MNLAVQIIVKKLLYWSFQGMYPEIHNDSGSQMQYFLIL